MNPQTMTDEQIHQRGIEALVNQLGLLGTIRFLQQYGTEGNYSVKMLNGPLNLLKRKAELNQSSSQ